MKSIRSSVRATRLRLAASAVLAVGLLATTAPVSSAAPPSNDMFDSAAVIDGSVGTVNGVTTTATKESGEPNHAGVLGGKSVWYQWTAPRTGQVAFDTVWPECGWDTLLAVYTGDRVDTLTTIASNDDVSYVPVSRLTFRATQGTTYLVAIDGLAGKGGQYRLHWGMTPPNDDFASAKKLRGLAGTAPVIDNAAATTQPKESRTRAHSVWYRWSAPKSGMVMFSTRRSDFSAYTTIFRGARLSKLHLVAIDLGGPRFTQRVEAGRTYSIAVSSFYGFWTGKVHLKWRTR